MFRHPTHNRAGFALPVAILAIVVIGALIAGAFFASSQEFKVGRNTLSQQRAFSAAEYGIGAVVDTIRGSHVSGLNVGESVTTVASVTDSTPFATQRAYDTIRVTKLTSATTYATALVTSTGQLQDGAARRRSSMMLRFVYPNMTMPGALTVNGGLTISGSSQISGADNMPSGWGGCPQGNNGVPGIATQPGVTINVNGSGCENLSCVTSPTGTRQLQTSTAADSSTYFNYGSATWTSLVAAADIRLTTSPDPAPTLNAANACDRTNTANWGEPRRDATAVVACQNYYPIIYIDGTARQNSQGRGQGILLVNGDLILTGGFEFYGPVIVRGEVRSRGNNTIYGTLASANVDLDGVDSSVNGNPTIMYSSCAISKATSGAAVAQPLTQRAWTEMP